MSASAKIAAVAEPPPEWAQLLRVAEEAAQNVRMWRQRALRAEAEAARLRTVLEQTDTAAAANGGSASVAARCRAENEALRSRMAEAHHRVTLLLARLDALEARP